MMMGEMTGTTTVEIIIITMEGMLAGAAMLKIHQVKLGVLLEVIGTKLNLQPNNRSQLLGELINLRRKKKEDGITTTNQKEAVDGERMTRLESEI